MLLQSSRRKLFKASHKRHPKPCRYNKNCRLGSNCLYKHTKEQYDVGSDKSKNDDKMKALEEKIDQMKCKAEKQIKLLEYKVSCLMEENLT